MSSKNPSPKSDSSGSGGPPGWYSKLAAKVNALAKDVKELFKDSNTNADGIDALRRRARKQGSDLIKVKRAVKRLQRVLTSDGAGDGDDN